jgi:hypothetical protein
VNKVYAFVFALLCAVGAQHAQAMVEEEKLLQSFMEEAKRYLVPADDNSEPTTVITNTQSGEDFNVVISNAIVSAFARYFTDRYIRSYLHKKRKEEYLNSIDWHEPFY